MKKRLLTVLFLLGILCLASGIAEKTCGDYQYGVLEDGSALITQYTGNDTAVIIPPELDGHPVTAIWYDAFSAKGMNSVSIPDSVRDFAGNPFTDCMNLTDIILSPDHPYLEMADGALFRKQARCLFWYPVISADTYSIPEGTEHIGMKAFFHNKTLRHIDIPGSVREIDTQAFDGCDALGSVWIDEGLTAIGYAGFSECVSLTDVHFPESLTEIGSFAFAHCVSLGSVLIPDAVTSIKEGAFYQCVSLQTAELPQALTDLGENAFSGCSSLASVQMPAGPEIINFSTFEGCVSLVEIEIPEGVTEIRGYAFKDCFSLQKVILPASLEKIGTRNRDMKTGKKITISPFTGCTAISFVVPRNSEAEKFCQQNGYDYTYPDEAGY